MSEAAKKLGVDSEPQRLEGETLKRLITMVKSLTGITMEERKKTMLFGRLRPRLRELGLESFEQYIERLSSTPNEVQEFVNLVTTNETHFFRTQVVWDYFQKEFLPRWIAENPGGQLRVWSAASSSGEEAYSLAMSCEDIRLLHPNFRYRIYGSDISTEVLDSAKSGIFSGKVITELRERHPSHLKRYFSELENGQFKANEVLTKNLEFSIHNLHKKPVQKDFFDIVFLRNVLIYFNDQDQELVLKQIAFAMKKRSLLILGESESLSRLKTDFQFIKPLVYSKCDSQKVV